MKRFRFKLQTLLDQRNLREDLLQAELGAIRREEAAEMARLGELHRRLKQAWTMVETALYIEKNRSVHICSRHIFPLLLDSQRAPCDSAQEMVG